MPSPSPKLLQEFVPAPIGGWNVRDPFWAMPENDARQIDNIFPDTSYCRVRGGSTEFATLGNAQNAGTLARLFTPAGSEKFLAVTFSNLYDITAGGAGVDITPGGWAASQSIWEATAFSGRLFFANTLAAGKIFSYDGATATVLTVTVGPANDQFRFVSAYRERLYFTEVNSTSVWYAQIGEINNFNLLEFDFGTVFQQGGKLVATGYTTKATGNITAEFFVAVSSEGEVLVYQGSYPGDSTWGIVGRFFIAKPQKGRCLFYIAGDMHIVTRYGPIPMSSLLAGLDVNNEYIVVAGKVQKQFITASYGFENDERWSGVYFNQAPYALINVPVATNNTHQYVMNTITKAWCRFTGWDAFHFATFNNFLYFGAAGKVYRADVPITIDTAAITWGFRNAYTALGYQNLFKTFTEAQPLFTANNGTGSAGTSAYTIRLNGDFQETDSNTTSASMNTGAGVQTLNNANYLLQGSGQWAGIGLEGTFAAAVDARFFGINLYGQVGGLGGV